MMLQLISSRVGVGLINSLTLLKRRGSPISPTRLGSSGHCSRYITKNILEVSYLFFAKWGNYTDFWAMFNQRSINRRPDSLQFQKLQWLDHKTIWWTSETKGWLQMHCFGHNFSIYNFVKSVVRRILILIPPPKNHRASDVIFWGKRHIHAKKLDAQCAVVLRRSHTYF